MKNAKESEVTTKRNDEGEVVSIGMEFDPNQIPELIETLDELGAQFEPGQREQLQLCGPASSLPEA